MDEFEALMATIEEPELKDIGARWLSNDLTVIPGLQLHAVANRDIVIAKGSPVHIEWILDAGAYEWLAKMMAEFEGKRKRRNS